MVSDGGVGVWRWYRGYPLGERPRKGRLVIDAGVPSVILTVDLKQQRRVAVEVANRQECR